MRGKHIAGLSQETAELGSGASSLLSLRTKG